MSHAGFCSQVCRGVCNATIISALCVAAYILFHPPGRFFSIPLIGLAFFTWLLRMDV